MINLSNPYLISFSSFGIKGLSKKISLQFHQKKFFDSNPYGNNIKGIYGVNGSGKSSLVISLSVLKKLLSDSDYLAGNKQKLDDLVNFETKSFGFTIAFAYFDDGEERRLLKIYEYSISVTPNAIGYVISSESLDEISASSITGPRKSVFSIVNGQIEKLKRGTSKAYSDYLIKTFNNALYRSSFLSLGPTLEATEDDDAKYFDTNTFSSGIVALHHLQNSLFVYVMGEEIPSEPYGCAYKPLAKNDVTPSLLENMIENRNHSFQIVKAEYLDTYKKRNKCLEKFVKLFKPDLETIELNAKDYKPGFLAVERVFNYGTYKVDSYLESTGIRKISSIFFYLLEVVQGGIVFIDELDANINSIYLSSLLSYISSFGKGQLCFTSHSTALMSTLKDMKYGIDFISSGHYLSSWKKNGNHIPETQWTKGYIPGFAFNLESEDFLSIFPPDEKVLEFRIRQTRANKK